MPGCPPGFDGSGGGVSPGQPVRVRSRVSAVDGAWMPPGRMHSADVTVLAGQPVDDHRGVVPA